MLPSLLVTAVAVGFFGIRGDGPRLRALASIAPEMCAEPRLRGLLQRGRVLHAGSVAESGLPVSSVNVPYVAR